MYKVLIVDDEPIIRKGLLKIVDWAALDCEVIDLASNALDALKILDTTNIDIIISDIKMPGMSGIDLAKHIYENKISSKIILLTGFSDFTYAQCAIKYNVIDFILKPTNIDSISTAIEKAKLALIKSNSNISKIKILEEQMLHDSEKLKISLLHDILSNVISPKEISTKLINKNINLNNYYVLLSKITSDSGSISDLLEISNLIFSDMLHYNITINANTVCTIVSADLFNEKSDIAILDLSHEIVGMLKNFKACTVSIGISKYHSLDIDLPQGYLEAKNALEFTFYSQVDTNVFLSSDCKLKNLNESTMLSYVNNTIQHLNNIDLQPLLNSLDTMFTTFKENYYNIENIKHICILICSKCSDLLLNENISFVDLIENPNIFADILNSTSIEDLKALITNSIDITFYTLNNKPNEKNSIVDNAKNYITKNYTDPNLTLNCIANHVHVSNAYLSRLFKEKTGETISELIIKFRINKAKDLLRNSNLKIYEIAYKIGIDDPAYFSQLFKKTTGSSPKEYKYNH